MKAPLAALGRFLLAVGLRRPRAKAVGTVVSFPKSGRTWLRVMLDKMGLPMHYTHAGSEYTRSLHFRELRVDGVGLKGAAMLFLHRDPRDTVVSGYFQKTLRIGSGCELPMSEFIRDPHLGLEKVILFNLAWLEHAARTPGFHTIGYEELRADPVGGLSLVAACLRPGAPVDRGAIERIVEESSFQRMREQEKSGQLAKQYGSILTPAAAENPDSFKVRRGKIGGYVDYFTPEDIRWCDEVLARHDYFRRVAVASAKVGLLKPKG